MGFILVGFLIIVTTLSSEEGLPGIDNRNILSFRIFRFCEKTVAATKIMQKNIILPFIFTLRCRMCVNLRFYKATSLPVHRYLVYVSN